MYEDEIDADGWTSTPADAGAIFGNKSYLNEPGPLSINEIEFPSYNELVSKCVEYVKSCLHPETFNHSMRVYYIGMAITKQQFPERYATLNPATWALTCLFHDIGTAEKILTASRMSFDIYGGIRALSVLLDLGATNNQAEAVVEAIIRHQDMGVDGTITYIGQLIQLATTYDNTGVHPRIKDFGNMIHYETRKQINEKYPRLQWSKFFSGTIRKEEAIKPWCHSTHLVNFADEIEGNQLFKEWET